MGVLANPDLNQAMVPSKQKRTHAVLRASSAHRSASTSKPRFVGEYRRVKLSEICSKGKSSLRQKDVFDDGPYAVYGASGIVGTMSVYQNEAPYVAVVKDGAGVGRANACEPMTSVLGTMQALIPNSDVDRDYLLHLVRSLHLGRGFSGSTIPHIYFRDYGKIEVPLPSIDAQKRIVFEFGSVEAQIAQAETQIKQLDSLVKSRFVEMFGDLEHGYKCSSCKLESIAEVGSSRRVFKNELLSEGVPFYRGTEVAELSAGGSIKPNLFISKEHYERLIGSTGKPEIGDLLLPSICPGGQIWCVNTNAPFYFKDGRVLWIRPDRDAVDGVYLRHALSTMFQMSFSNIASGTTFAELKIFLLKELNVPLPELKDQKEFVSFASQVDKSGFATHYNHLRASY